MATKTKKVQRKIRLAPGKKFYELLVKDGSKPFRVEKSNLTLDQVMKESALIGYKNLWVDITKK